MPGLELLKSPASGRATADVVFIHGLGSNGSKAWGFNGEHPTWDTWLSEDFPTLNVWNMDYPASPSKWVGTAMPLQQRAVNILSQLDAEDLGQRPLAFVTHSMGGLVVKQMLRAAKGDIAPQYEHIADKTEAVVFFATPHTGADVAKLADYLGFFLRRTVAIEDLQPNAAVLLDLDTWFRNSFLSSGIDVQVFRENETTKGVLVVDAAAADPGLPGVAAISVDADHSGISKPPRKEDFRYTSIRKLLKSGLFGSTYVDILKTLFPLARDVEAIARAADVSVSDTTWESVIRHACGTSGGVGRLHAEIVDRADHAMVPSLEKRLGTVCAAVVDSDGEASPASWYQSPSAFEARFVGTAGQFPFINRQALRDELPDFVAGWRVLLVNGEPGTGRTHTWYAVAHVGRENNFECHHINIENRWAQQDCEPRDLMRSIGKALGLDEEFDVGASENHGQLARLLVERLQRSLQSTSDGVKKIEKVCVVIDGLDRANVKKATRTMVENLVHETASENVPRLWLVVTGSAGMFEGPPPLGAKSESIEGIREEHLREFFTTVAQHRGQLITEEEAGKIVAKLRAQVRKEMEELAQVKEIKSALDELGVAYTSRDSKSALEEKLREAQRANAAEADVVPDSQAEELGGESQAVDTTPDLGRLAARAAEMARSLL